MKAHSLLPTHAPQPKWPSRVLWAGPWGHRSGVLSPSVPGPRLSLPQAPQSSRAGASEPGARRVSPEWFRKEGMSGPCAVWALSHTVLLCRLHKGCGWRS